MIARMTLPKDEPLAERLNRLHFERKMRLTRAAEQKSIDELKECTFKPNVPKRNHKSKQKNKDA